MVVNPAPPTVCNVSSTGTTGSAGKTTTKGIRSSVPGTGGSRSRSGSTEARKQDSASSIASGRPFATSASTWRSNSSSASAGRAATGSAVIGNLSGEPRRASSVGRRTIGGHSGSPWPPSGNTIQHRALRPPGQPNVCVVHGTAVQPAEDDRRQRAGRGRLVEDTRVRPVQIRSQPPAGAGKGGREEGEGATEPGNH